MKTPTVMAIVLALFLSSAPIRAAEPAPDWTLTSSEGGATRLSAEVREQPVVLFFWATWCPYCKALMPHLQSIRLEHGDEVKILAINFVEKGDPVGFLKELGYDFTLLPDGDEVAAIYGVYGTPGVILVDQDQQIRFDLRTLPQLKPPGDGSKTSHKKKAAYLAPYWAAELRKSIDSVLEESTQ
jgi:cytochrome c biogenesis protein CcmG/thiol:disulfide interchange protein DsbE